MGQDGLFTLVFFPSASGDDKWTVQSTGANMVHCKLEIHGDLITQTTFGSGHGNIVFVI